MKKRAKILKGLKLTFFWLLLFFLPSQLGYHFWPDFAFIFGIKVDYLAPTVYLTDLLIVALLGLSWREFFRRRYLFIFLPFFLFAVFNLFFAASPVTAGFKWLKVLELTLFGLWLTLNQKLIYRRETAWVFFASLLTICLIGIGQFVWQKTLGGPLSLLGERTFTKLTPGIALVSLFGQDFLRAYSTFSHPNSFAGYLVPGALLFLNLNRGFEVLAKGRTYLFGAILSLAFFLTFSLGAYLGFFFILLGFWLSFRQKRVIAKILPATFFVLIILSLLLPSAGSLVDSIYLPESVRLRLVQATVAEKIFSAAPILGVGLNNYFRVSHSLQPVHNLFLLVLAETGLIGLVGISFLFFTVFKNNKNIFWQLAFLFILITGFFDHYWLTLQQNQLLLALLFGMVYAKKNN